ncbi:MAG: glycoside hydrolase family 3 N-terminal domain-containing protein [Gemmatimonadota bacterium]
MNDRQSGLRSTAGAVVLSLIIGLGVPADASTASWRGGTGARADPDPSASAWVERTLAAMDLRQRVAQLVLAWIPGGEIPVTSAEYRRIRRWIEEDHVGGLIVSRGPADEFAPMLNALQRLAPVPLLIVSDLETGPGMRLQGGAEMPPAMAFGAAGSEALAREAGRITAREAAAAGIHATLGPVLDVNSNPFNPIINTRSFGEDPQLVARLAAAWIEGARAEGLMTLGKHFPGHGATEVDSHMGLPMLESDLAELEELELVPFRAAIASGVDGMLVGHIALPAIDGPGAPPASLSSAVIHGLLRERLGFDGLVVTDALNMGAVTENYTVPEASILALKAGADLLLQPPDHGIAIDSIVAAVESGRIGRERIDEAVRRVLTAKARAGLHQGSSVAAPGGRTPPEHETVAETVTAASLTLVRDREDLLPIRGEVRRVLHVTYAPPGTRFAAGSFDLTLRSSGREVESVRVTDRTAPVEYEAIAARARRADLVIVSSNVVPREYSGALALRDDYSRFAERLIAGGTPVIAISFGSPYLLDFFPSVSTYLLAWSGSARSQRAAGRALVGAPIGGRLPVSLPPHHLAGEGLDRPNP